MAVMIGVLKNAKRAAALLLPLIFLLSAFAACGNAAPPAESGAANTAPADAAGASVPDSPSEAAEEAAQPDAPGGKVLVAVFSATGTTKAVAEKIAAIENADMYEIVPAEPYSDADLNYYDFGSRAIKEQSDKSVRPEIAGELVDLSGYEKLYLGFPIWCAEEPRIMDTFAESCDFSGLTVIPFCTSGSSDIGKNGQRLAELAGSGNWLDGKRFPGSATEADVQSWIDSLR